ncbi:MAG: ferritin family protein [Bacteroidales bacterium]|jgi:rubrerythrin|nr:ferritin family protein [Bacteroidales bacterium]
MRTFNTIDEVLDFAIQAEQEAVDFYNYLSNSAQSEGMRKAFVQYAQEEMGHKMKLLQIQSSGLFQLSAERVLDLRIADYLVDVIPSTSLSYAEALQLAMRKELAAFRMYTELAGQAKNEEIKNVFQSLAFEESKHKLRFELEYDEIVLKDN